jgi:hypothetical protein
MLMTETEIPTPDVSLIKRLTEPKNLVALGLLALGVGIILGSKLASGGEPFVKYVEVPGPERVVRDHRCADCEEKAIRAARVVTPTAEPVVDAGRPGVAPEPDDHPRVFSPYDHPAAGSDVPEDDD